MTVLDFTLLIAVVILTAGALDWFWLAVVRPWLGRPATTDEYIPPSAIIGAAVFFAVVVAYIFTGVP